jgi:hypothetical protein
VLVTPRKIDQRDGLTRVMVEYVIGLIEERTRFLVGLGGIVVGVAILCLSRLGGWC